MTIRLPTTKEIVSISLIIEDDVCPDLSYLGNYSDEWSEGCIDRRAEGVMRYNDEYRYFKPSNHVPFRENDWDHVSEELRLDVIKKYGSLKNASKQYAREDWKRAEAYTEGKFSMLCVHLLAKFKINKVDLTIISPTICGIESDSGPEELKTLLDDLFIVLKRDLNYLEFPNSMIDPWRNKIIFSREWY